MNSNVCWSLVLSWCMMMCLVCSTLAQETVFRGELTKEDKTHKRSEGFVDYHLIKASAGQLLTVIMSGAKD